MTAPAATGPAEAVPIVPPAPASRGWTAPLLAPFNVNLDELAFRTEHLPPELRVAYARFLVRLWHWGDVLSDEADLARAFGLRLRAFRRGRNLLSILFTIDAAGGWRDLDVEARRAAALAHAGPRAGQPLEGLPG